MSDDHSDSPMTALERYCLEYLADRAKSAFEAHSLADWIDKPLPKVSAALRRLRDRRFVAYYVGDPGAWAVTGAGQAVIAGEIEPAPTERYRLALEIIANTNFIEASMPLRIAKRALA